MIPGIIIDEDPESLIPPAVEGLMPSVTADVAQHRAEKYVWGMNGKPDTPDVDSMRTSIMNGGESIERQRAAHRRTVDNQIIRQGIVRDMVRNANGAPLSNEQFKAVMNLSDTAVENPDTVLEREYADRLLTEVASSSKHWENAVFKLPEETHTLGDAMVDMVTRKEGHQKIVEDMEARYQKMGPMEAALDTLEQWVPFKSWWNTQSVTPNSADAFLSGKNWKQQYEHIAMLRPDESIRVFKETMETIAKSNVNDAIAFGRGMLAYSSTDETIGNIMNSYLSLAELVPGVGMFGGVTKGALTGSAKALKGTANTLGAVVKAAGNRTTSVPEVLEAAGRTTEAAQVQAWKKIEELVRPTHDPNSFESLKGEVASIVDPSKIFTGASTNLSREETQHLVTTMMNRAQKLVEGTLYDPVAVRRLEPGTPAYEAAIREADLLRKTEYANLNDAVLDVAPIHNRVINADYLAVRFGTHPGDQLAMKEPVKGMENISIKVGDIGKPQLFGSEEAARLVADEMYGLKSFTIGQQGDGYYIQVIKPVPETSPSVRAALAAETKNAQTPSGFINTFFGYFRSGLDKAPVAITDE